MNNHATAAIIWCLAIIAVSVPVAVYLFRNKASK